MESIIEKAIEGGFVYDDVSDEAVVCDPLFWKSLGKACGWKMVCQACHNHFTYRNSATIDKNSTGYTGCDYGTKTCPDMQSGWKYYAFRFHEINLTESWEAAVNYLNKITK